MDFDWDEGLPETSQPQVAKSVVKAREIEEDDYDDDEDDGQHPSMIPQAPDPSNQDANSSMDSIGRRHD